MDKTQAQVRDFMRAMDHPTPKKITVLSEDRALLRLRLILEETVELVEASGFVVTLDEDGGPEVVHRYGAKPNLPEQIDALCDLKYVTDGMGVEMGVDLEPFFELVHEANMKKGPGPVRKDGKKLKPEGWTAPDIKGAIARYQRMAQLDEDDPDQA